MSVPLESVDAAFQRFCATADPQALAHVFDATAPEVLRVALYLTQNRTDAEDVLQSTFLAAIESRMSYAPDKRALPWLMGILANQARRLRRQRSRQQRELAPRPEPGVDPLVEVATRELAQRLSQLHAELGEPYAPVLQLHLAEGLNAKRIAERLRRPSGTVRTQIVRALEILRQRLPDGALAGILAFAGEPPAITALAAIRQKVIAAAEGAAAPVATGAAAAVALSLGSFLVAKFFLVALFVFVVGLGIWFAASGPDSSWRWNPELSPRADSADAATSPGPDALRSTDAQRVAAAEPEPTTKLDPGFGRVRVRVRWEHDGSPAGSTGVFASNGFDPARRDAVTAVDGTAELPHLAPGRWTIRTALGRDSMVLDLPAGEEAWAELTAVRKALVTGSVVDVYGQPIADARLWVSVSEGEHGHEVTRSSATGQFEVPIHGKHWIGARKPGLAPSRVVKVEVADDGTTTPSVLTLSLRQVGGVLRGTVRDVKGNPVTWARVRVGANYARELDTVTQPSREAIAPGPEATTDRRGHFEILEAPVGTCEVRAWALGHAPAKTEATVPMGGASEVVLTLGLGATLHGTARNESGKPVAGATVFAFPSFQSDDPSRYQWQTECDPAGNYELIDLPEGELRVWVWHRGSHAVSKWQPNAGDALRWDPVLPKSLDVSGRIFNELGEPMAGLTVRHGDVRDFGPVPGSANATTDDSGAFHLREVGGVPFWIEVSDHGQVAYESDVLPGTGDLKIIMEHPAAFITGRLMTEQSVPVSGRVVAYGGASDNFVQADPTSGSFVVGPLRGGRYRLLLQSPDVGMHDLGEHQLVPKQRLDLGTTTLAAPGSLVIHVTVEGRPLVSGSVGLTFPGGPFTDFDVDDIPIENGRGHHGRIRPGRVWLIGEFQGWQVIEVDVTPGQEVHAYLDLQPTSDATVTIRDSHHALLGGEIRVRGRDRHFVNNSICRSSGETKRESTWTTWMERFRMPTDRYVVEFRATDGRIVIGELDLRSGAAQLTLELPAKK